MAHLLDYSLLSEDAYRSDSEPMSDLLANWARKKIFTIDAITGEKAEFTFKESFFARMYKHLLTNEIVVAFRGTTSFRDLIPDIKLAFKVKSSYCSYANDFYDACAQYLKDESSLELFSVTGHSLGGYLAQYVAQTREVKSCVVFNAPSLGNYKDTVIGYVDPKIKHDNFYYINVDEDIVPIVGTPVGNVIRLHDERPCEYSKFTDFAFSSHDQGMFYVKMGSDKFLHNLETDYHDRPCGKVGNHSISYIVNLMNEQYASLANRDL